MWYFTAFGGVFQLHCSHFSTCNLTQQDMHASSVSYVMQNSQEKRMGWLRLMGCSCMGGQEERSSSVPKHGALSHSSWAPRNEAQEMDSGSCSPWNPCISSSLLLEFLRRMAQLLKLSMSTAELSRQPWPLIFAAAKSPTRIPIPTYLWVSHNLSLLVPTLAASWLSPAGEDFSIFCFSTPLQEQKMQAATTDLMRWWKWGLLCCFLCYWRSSSSTESDLLRLIFLKHLLVIYAPSSVLILKGWEMFGPLH